MPSCKTCGARATFRADLGEADSEFFCTPHKPGIGGYSAVYRIADDPAPPRAPETLCQIYACGGFDGTTDDPLRNRRKAKWLIRSHGSKKVCGGCLQRQLDILVKRGGERASIEKL